MTARVPPESPLRTDTWDIFNSVGKVPLKGRKDVFFHLGVVL
jgi:hypothetical protein